MLTFVKQTSILITTRNNILLAKQLQNIIWIFMNKALLILN